jgi:hypothetical protein
MTFRDAIGEQHFDSCKTTNKKEAEQRLTLRRKETLEGIVPAPAIQPIVLDDLKQRYLAFVEHQRGVATKKIHFAHFNRIWGNPPIHTPTVDILDHYRALRLAEKVGPTPINWEDVKHGLDRAYAATGLTNFHFHDLRMTFASWHIMRGVLLSGHTSPTMTLRYAHLSPKHLTSAVRVLDAAPTHFDRKGTETMEMEPSNAYISTHADSQSSDYRFGHVGNTGTVSMNLFLKDTK